MDIDLREEFDELLEKWGYDIDYHRLTPLPCPQCEGKNHESCSKCFATGKKLILEKKRTRRKTASVPETWPRMTHLRPIGNWQVPGYIYYMRYDSNPKTLDLIVEKTEGSFKQILEINLVDPLRGVDGRIEYYRIAVSYKQTKAEFI